MNRHHALRFAAEGDLSDSGLVAIQRGLLQAGLLGGDDQGRFRGVPEDDGATVDAVDPRVAAQGADPEGQSEVLVARGIDALASDPELAGRGVPAAGDLDPPGPELERTDRHLVLGQGAGLVGADHRGRAQGLHGGQPADQDAHAGHPLHPQGQGHGRDRQQPFRHRGDGQRDAHLQHVQERVAAKPTRQDDHEAERQDDADQQATELGQLPLERRVPIVRTLDQRADLPDLAAHAGGGDDHPASPVRHRGAHEEHVPPVGDRRVRVRDGFDGLGDRLGLAGQGCLFGLQPRAHNDAPVRGHPRAGVEGDYVTWDERGGGDLMLLAIADDMRHRRDLLPEGGEGLRRLPLGQEADERVQEDDGDDGGRLDALVQGEGHRGRGQQQDHDEALELIDENRKKRPRRLLGERVGAVPLEAAGRLDAAQAVLGLGVDAPAHLVSGQRVPRFGVLGNGRPHRRGHFTRSTGTGE